MTDPKPFCDCTKIEAITYQLRGYAQDHGQMWADITIREWNEGGSIDVQSDLGGYSYTWHAIGNMKLREFLCKLDFDYFMTKTTGRRHLEFDPDKTQEAILKDICRARHGNHISRGRARLFYDDVTSVQTASYMNCLSHFLEVLCDKDALVREVYCRMGEDIEPIRTPTAVSANFWRHIWPAACKVWRDELAQEVENGCL